MTINQFRNKVLQSNIFCSTYDDEGGGNEEECYFIQKIYAYLNKEYDLGNYYNILSWLKENLRIKYSDDEFEQAVSQAGKVIIREIYNYNGSISDVMETE